MRATYRRATNTIQDNAESSPSGVASFISYHTLCKVLKAASVGQCREDETITKLHFDDRGVTCYIEKATP